MGRLLSGDGPPQPAAVAALAVAVAAAGALAARTGQVPPGPAPRSKAVRASGLLPAPLAPAGRNRPPAAGVGITRDRTAVRTAPAPHAPVAAVLREGITLPVGERWGGLVQVLTPCERSGWVAASSLRLLPPPPSPPPGRTRRMGEAVVVLDAGHGGRLAGARGPGGLAEKDVNLDVVRRLAALLSRPRDVDWASGAVSEGLRYPPPQVVVTRSGDFEAGLAFRAAVANAAAADAFLSVHHNSDPDGPLPRPGTETYYQYRSPLSRRLAGLAYEEVVRSLSRFAGIAWVGDRDAGAKYRLSERGDDYYALLRRAVVPAVIVESAFISNPPEEALLATPPARQAIAEALYRALVRYLTTDDPGSGFTEPYPRAPGPAGRLPAGCVDPA